MASSAAAAQEGSSPEAGAPVTVDDKGHGRVVFRHELLRKFGTVWEARAVNASPCAGMRFSYFNNSRNAHNSNILQVILRDHGFHKTEPPDGEWNIFWCAGQVDPLSLRLLKPYQKVNKFPKASCLTLKANLWSSFLRMQTHFGSVAFGHMPQTCVLPGQLEMLEEWMEAPENDEVVWIIKPAAAYCGKGINLYRSGQDLPEEVKAAKGVACRYIDPPYLINGLKSDIRLYVLVTSWNPLVVYLYEEGLARFATELYNLEHIERRCMHLTNYSLNKHNKRFVPNTDASQDDAGSKWSLSAFRRQVSQDFGEAKAAEIWRAIDDIVVKTVISVEHIMSGALPNYLAAAAHGEHNSQCFQVFGFDVMLDGTGRPWLLEVNLDPALGTESPIDHKIKSHMLVDLLNVVGVPVPAANAEETMPMPMPMPVSQQAADSAEAVGPATAAPLAPTAMPPDTARGADGFTEREREALRLVNAEFERSQQGEWRRLFPSPRSKEYAGFLDPARQMHHLPFVV